MSPSCPGFLLRGAQGVCEIEADLSALDVPSLTPDSTPAGCMSIWGPGSLQDSVFPSVKQRSVGPAQPVTPAVVRAGENHGEMSGTNPHHPPATSCTVTRGWQANARVRSRHWFQLCFVSQAEVWSFRTWVWGSSHVSCGRSWKLPYEGNSSCSHRRRLSGPQFPDLQNGMGESELMAPEILSVLTPQLYF